MPSSSTGCVGAKVGSSIVCGIGAMQQLARKLGPAAAIDAKLRLLKVHPPYSESDHVLNLAYNTLAGGTCIEDLELLRTSEGFLDAVGAQRIPDPTTAGDFCRRFTPEHVDVLQDVFNETRLKVWQRQPTAFFEQAIIEADGTPGRRPRFPGSPSALAAITP